MVAPIRFLTGRQQQQKIGVIDSTENSKVLEVIGRVGIGTTVFEPTNLLDVRGDANISGDLTLGDTTIGADILSISGIATFTNTTDNVLGNSNTGSVQIDGGLGIDQNVTVGAALSVVTNLRVGGISTFQDNVYFNNSTRLKFGDDEHLEIYRVGNESFIHDSGPGGLSLSGASVKIENDTQDEDGLVYTSNAGVEIFHNGIKKFETTGFGATVFGGLNVSGVSTFQGNVNLGDNDRILFDGTQLALYAASDLPTIALDGGSTNGGYIILNGGKLQIRKSAHDGEQLATFNVDGGIDLYHDDSKKFETTGIGVSISNGGTDTATIAGPENLIIDPAAVGDNTGLVRIKGDLYVDGTTTQINSTTIEFADFVVGIATTATTDLLTDGAGIGIGSDKTFLYEHNSGTNPSLKSSENLNVASGKHYQIGETEVLSATTLGSGVVNSSLTSVGTLNGLTVSGIATATTFSGTLENDLTLGVSGTGLSGSATYNNSGAVTFTVTSDATSANTADTIVSRDSSGNFSAGTITANLTGTATTATNLADGANITTGTISDDRLPDLITSNINIASGISSVATLDATNATIDNVTFTSGTAITSVDTDLSSVSTSDDTLASAKAIKTYVDSQVTAQDLDFTADTGGTRSIDLDSEIFSILGTANEIETAGSPNTVTIGLPNEVAITTSLVVGSAVTITSSGINVPTGVITASSFVGSIVGTLTGIAATATALENPRDFSITGDFVTAPTISFDGTANVALAATITPNSIGLGTYTSGDYVQSITGTTNEIEVTSGTGEGSTPTIGLPNDVTISNDLTVSNNLNVSGVSTFQGNVDLGNDDILRFGDGPDLEIYSNGSTSFIKESGSGNLKLLGNNIVIKNTQDTEFYADFNHNGSVDLYYDNSKKFETTGYGVTVSGGAYVSGISTFQDNVHFGDNDVLNFGAGDDLQIYSDGTDSYILEQGTGLLSIDSSYIRLRSGDGNTTTATFTHGTGSFGGVQLYWGGDKKFETTGYGVSITGGAYVSGISTFQNNIEVTGTISVNDTTIVGSETASLSTVTETAIHTGLSASTYRSVEYNIQATQGTNYHVTKILALHNGTTAYHNEYGTIYNNTSVATFNVDVSGGNLRLLATSASASQTDYVVNFTATKI
jgi:hypothetical protein